MYNTLHIADFDNKRPLEEELVASFMELGKKSVSFIKKIFGLAGLVALSPLLLLGLAFITFLSQRMAKRMQKSKTQLIKEINNAPFQAIKDFEGSLSPFIVKYSELAISCKNMERYYLVAPFAKNITSFYSDLKEIDNAVKDNYKWSKNDFGMSAKDYKAYCDQIKSLSDVWNYETDSQEQEFVFNHKKAI